MTFLKFTWIGKGDNLLLRRQKCLNYIGLCDENVIESFQLGKIENLKPNIIVNCVTVIGYKIKARQVWSN